MRTITIVFGASLLCVIAPTSSKAKTDHAKCEDTCRAYHCADSVCRELYFTTSPQISLKTTAKTARRRRITGRFSTLCERQLPNQRRCELTAIGGHKLPRVQSRVPLASNLNQLKRDGQEPH